MKINMKYEILFAKGNQTWSHVITYVWSSKLFLHDLNLFKKINI